MGLSRNVIRASVPPQPAALECLLSQQIRESVFEVADALGEAVV
ncbi:MAG: hypothetical protein JWP83_4223 [Mycobacterium sp.]|jgi:hypothetical protein|nr:hypothetical protein [Mycobacterium sp.]